MTTHNTEVPLIARPQTLPGVPDAAAVLRGLPIQHDCTSTASCGKVRPVSAN